MLQLAIDRVIGIAFLLAAIESRAVVGRQREAFAEAARQIGIGNEDAAERDGVGMPVGDRRVRRLSGETAGRDQDPVQIGRTSTIADGTF